MILIKNRLLTQPFHFEIAAKCGIKKSGAYVKLMRIPAEMLTKYYMGKIYPIKNFMEIIDRLVTGFLPLTIIKENSLDRITVFI